MSRAKVTTTAMPLLDLSGAAGPTPPMTEEPGLSGPFSTLPTTLEDAGNRVELGRLLAAARDIRPVLRAQQAQTEEDGRYSDEVHEYFLEHGFYTMLLPKRFGGLGFDPERFFMVIAEVGRGCPSTSWCLSLSQAHALTLASYWPIEVQERVFGETGYLIAPSGGSPNATVVAVEGGYRLSGTWRYCSGAPYSTHFFPTINVPGANGSDGYRAWAIISRKDYTVLDDWGRVIGMRGSGSNSIQIDDAFVPAEHIVAETWTSEIRQPTVGFSSHGDPIYSGVFYGFAEGEVAAAMVGLGYAAVDEYERVIRTTKAPYSGDGSLRADFEDWRRVLGMAMSKVDAAAAAVFDGGRKYVEYARRLVENGERFDEGRAMRLNNQYFVAEELVWEAVQELIRTAGTSCSADGQKLQRYFRDAWTAVSRTDQFQFFAAPAARSHFLAAAAFAESGAADVTDGESARVDDNDAA